MMPKRLPELTDETLRQAEELAGYGLRLDQIAAVLGFSERTMHRKREENEALEAAIRRGKAKASASVGKALFAKAKDGDVPAIRWWEMTRDGRSERTQNEAKVEVVQDAEADARLAKIVASYERRISEGSDSRASASPDAQ